MSFEDAAGDSSTIAPIPAALHVLWRAVSRVSQVVIEVRCCDRLIQMPGGSGVRGSLLPGDLARGWQRSRE
jgi:hypothetical protein